MGKEIKERLDQPQVLILDIPVIHKGYIDLLRQHAESVRTLYLVGEDVLASLQVPKEIRAVDTETTKELLQGLRLPFNIEIIHLDGLSSLPRQGILAARDSVSKKLRERFFPGAEVTEETVFLRWDESNVTFDRPGQFDRESNDPFDVQMIARTRELAEASSDWWRQVGVVVVRDRQILVEAYNQVFPTETNPYIDGNPRDHIKPGTLGFLSATIHAEQAAIASARGISLVGADLYLNSYPCHPCAMAMGLAGIVRCFFTGGNAYLNVGETLKHMGIETIFVREK